jgi:antitoxin component HigA of HigAB toxin-antitoxin module
MSRSDIERFTADPENMRLYQQERSILETTEMIRAVMEQGEVTKSNLAQKLGKSKAYITKLLDGQTNMTLRTISDTLWALNASLYVSAGPLGLSCELAAWAVTPAAEDHEFSLPAAIECVRESEQQSWPTAKKDTFEAWKSEYVPMLRLTG